MTADELRVAMRAFGKVSDADIERAVDALVVSGAAAVITDSKPIKSEGYLGFADCSGKRVAWLHVHHIDIRDDFVAPNSFAVPAYEFVRRVAFPGYGEKSGPQHKVAAPPLCDRCFNAPDYCECG